MAGLSRRQAAAARQRRQRKARLVEPVERQQRVRITSKSSGSRGWYDSPEWRARSQAHLKANPFCVRCGERAVLCDHIEPTRPDDREGVLHGPIQSSCRPCHFSKSRVEQGLRGDKPKVRNQRVLVGLDGLPLPGQPHWWSE